MKDEWPEISELDNDTADAVGKALQKRDEFLKEMQKETDKITEPAAGVALIGVIAMFGMQLCSSTPFPVPTTTPKPISIPTTVGFKPSTVLLDSIKPEPNEQANLQDPCSRLPSAVISDQAEQDRKILVHKCQVVQDEVTTDEETSRRTR